ncbi:MAG: DegT/DnrJ/EryC1/StrS family aminotransferase, partial [Fibrobacter sp.]|nr:DegT/DnrJ/EryC1/StrS family aminotransferase [Fibrobacter sp.]
KLKAAEIPYCIHYPAPLHMQPCFGSSKVRNANAMWASEHAISLPVCAFTNVDEIIAKLKA